MCFSKTKVPDPAPPPQAVKQPEVGVIKDKARANRSTSAMGGATLLTAPSGISSVSTGKTSMLGG